MGEVCGRDKRPKEKWCELGTYETEEEAALAYDKAKLNFPHLIDSHTPLKPVRVKKTLTQNWPKPYSLFTPASE